MIFTELRLPGAFLIHQERAEDARGFFARFWCTREFAAHGLNPALVQCNLSFNVKKGTLRGLHYQKAPNGEAKLVTCFQGAIYDVIVDLRPDSPTYGQWLAVELTGENLLSLYIPEGLAHGFQTLEDRTLVFYQMSEFYQPDSAMGVRWDDPLFGIVWPMEVTTISSKDNSYYNIMQL
ncbi:MAG: dTDP-4-dehydrorhamnose 3,5-epimerase [Syntrophales bacterium]|nr:dTDP-4-dehydrorhamnose 3,5-epimerase [Syntrophales bacterium]MDD5640356.1 dTDP-4-dehydrorhamnose 3,5-epimerase [Syntrophales bacterium]